MGAGVDRFLDFLDRHQLIVWLAALAFYIVVAMSLSAPVGVNDEDRYRQFSQALLDGEYSTGSRRGWFMWWGPGMSVLLAPFIALDTPLDILRLVFGPIAQAATVVLLWRVLLLEVGKRLAALGAIAYALYWPIWMETNVVLSEIPSTLFLVLALYLWIKARQKESSGYAVAAGVALGIVVLIRAELGYLLEVGLLLSLVLFAWRRSPAAKRSFIGALTAMIICLPWLAYTWTESGKVAYWGASGGQNLYWMAVSKPPLQGKAVMYDYAFKNRHFTEYWPFIKPLENRDTIDRDEAFRTEAIKEIKADPTIYLNNLWKSGSRLFFDTPRNFKPLSSVSPTVVVPNLVVLFAIVFGAVVLTLRRRWAAIAIAPVFISGGYLAGHVALSGLPRYLMPVVPIVAWFAVVSWARTRSDSAQPPATHQQV